MKNLRQNHFLLFLLVAFCTFFTKNSQAQNTPIQVTIIAPPPYPYTFSEYITRTGEPVLMLTNTDPFNAYSTKIGVTISGDNGISATSNAMKKPSIPIQLAALESRMFTGDDLLDIYVNHTIDDLTYSGLSLLTLVQSQTIPEGIYTACVTVFDFNTDAELSFESCTTPIPILGLDPPIITNPMDENVVLAQDPQLISFNWTPVAGAQLPISYHFRMVEIPNNVNLFDAMESDNFLIYDTEMSGDDLFAPILIYDSSFPILESDRQYAVQVTAFDPSGTTLIRNEGKSDIVTFFYERPDVAAPILLNPENVMVNAENPTQLVANWTNVIANEPIYYDLYLAEIPAGAEPVTHLLNTEPIEIGILANQFPYFPLLNNWEVGKNYAMIIRAYDELEELPIVNNGMSNVVVFQVENMPTTGNDNPINTTTQITGNFTCGEGCLVAPPQNVDAVNNFIDGNMVSIGNFWMELDDITINGNLISGKGLIQPTDFMPAALWATFENIQINNENEVFNGTVQADQRQGFSNIEIDWIDDDALINPNWGGSVDDIVEDVEDYVVSIYDAIDPQFELGASLPISYGEGDYQLVIVGINFTPMGATYSMITSIPMPGDVESGTKNLVFGGNNFCYSRAGFGDGGEVARLSLLQNTTYVPNDKYSLLFNKDNNEINPPTGTFARFDCDGFQDVSADGLVVFNNSLLVPDDGQGNILNGKMVMPFETYFAEWGNTLMEITVGQTVEAGAGPFRITPFFQHKNYPGYTFRTQNLIFDWSADENGNSMLFPPNYPNNNGVNWQGLYFENLEMRLPQWLGEGNERTVIQGNNILVDAHGFTGSFKATDLMADGTVSSMDFTIKDFNFTLLQNDLQVGEMEGEIKLPIADENHDYELNINRVPATDILDYNLQLVGNPDFKMSLWKADVVVNQHTIELDVEQGEADITAIFSGIFNFETSLGEIAGVDLNNIGFQNLTLTTESPYLSMSGFTTSGLNANMQVMGFGTSVDSLGINSIANKPTLQLGLGLKLGGEVSELDAKTVLNISSVVQTTPKLAFSFDDAWMEEITLDANVAGLEIVGNVVSYTSHPVYGNGFGGDISTTFLDFGEMGVTAKFGNKLAGKNRYNYWYVDANYASNTGLTLFSGLAMYGFGGGAFYNMNHQTIQPALNNQFGIFASVELGAQPESASFNGDFTLTGILNLNNSGVSLNSIGLDGNAYLMRERNSNKTAPISMTGGITYYHQTSELIGDFNAAMQVPPNQPILSGGGNLNFAFGRDDWHLHFGHPTDMFNVTYSPNLTILGKKLTLGSIGFDTYFVTGNGNLPAPPDFPAGLSSSVKNSIIRPSGTLGGSGFMTGLHTGFDFEFEKNVDLWLTTVGVYFDIAAGAGGDLMLTKNTGLPCGKINNYGINQWYAQGQGYLFFNGSAGATIAGKKLGVGLNASAAGTFGLPNPSGLSAAIDLEASLGPVSIDFQASAVVGEMCNFSESDLEGTFVNSLKLIKNTNISAGSIIEELDLADIRPRVNFYFGNTVQHNDSWYSINVEDQTGLYRVSSNGTKTKVSNVEIDWNYEGDSFKFKAKNGEEVILNDDTEYEIFVKVNLIKFEDKYWDVPVGEEFPFEYVEIDGNRIQETLRVKFRTYDIPSTIINPQASIPAFHERFFHKNDHKTGYVKTNQNDIVATLNLTDNKLIAKFVNLENQTQLIEDVTYSNGDFQFPVNNLESETRYKVRILLVRKNNTNAVRRELYQYHFATSKYVRLEDKIRAMSVEMGERHTEFSGYVGFNCESYTLKFKGTEGVSQREYEQFEMSLFHNSNIAYTPPVPAPAAWRGVYRATMLDLFSQLSGNPDPMVKEFYPEPINSQLLQPMEDSDFQIQSGGGLSSGWQTTLLPGNFASNYNIPVGNPILPSNSVVLRLRWNENEYIASLHKRMMDDITGIQSLSYEEFFIIFGDFQSMPAGEYDVEISMFGMNPRKYVSVVVPYWIVFD